MATPKTTAKAPAKKSAASSKPVKATPTPSVKAPPAAKKAVAKAPAKSPAPAKTTAASDKSAAPKRSKSPVPVEQRRNYVEVAAYFIAERHGFTPGRELADWAAAEAEIDRLLAEGLLNQ